MKELFKKLSSYNIFGYLFCGTVFAVLADKLLNYSLIQQNFLTGIFFYYFLGLFIDRTGAWIAKPFLKKISFLRFAAHQDLTGAAVNDEPFEVPLNMSNIYRSLCALFLLLLALKFYDALCSVVPPLAAWSPLLVILALLVSFIIFLKEHTSILIKAVEAGK